MKKIYFAGSIRGGRDDAALYGRIISRLKENHVVLTEHVGNPALTAEKAPTADDTAIYLQDTAWLRACDVVIAECSTPSLGVGYELAYAEALGKEVHILFDSRRGALSAMLTGNSHFHIHTYSEPGTLDAVLESIL